jgi:CubicO group peptidase (beta-lactamase class C family)
MSFSLRRWQGVLPFLLVASVVPCQVYPGANWERDSRGLSPEVRRRVDSFVRGIDTSALVIVKGGRIAYDYGDIKQLSYLASARKSVLSTLYGKYVANGTIKLDKTLKDLGMSDVGGLLPVEEKATVKDLISARSGVYHIASNPGDLLDIAPKRGSVEPGSTWLYSNWDFNAAGAAFEKMTGKDLFDALRDDIAKPIGMQDFQRKRQQKLGDLTRSQYPAYHMWLSTRDMARLGYLMLRGGKWNGKQLIPADWVRESTVAITPISQMKPESALKGPFGYGYMWWVWDGPFNSGAFKGAYTAMGAYGQYITVMPALDMVIAHKTVPVNRQVSQAELLGLLDRIAGKTPASDDVLPVLWKEGLAAAEARYHAIEANPGDRIANGGDLNSVGRELMRARQYDKAIQVFELNSKLYPNPLRTVTPLAEAHAAAGHKAVALEMAQKVLGFQARFRPARLLVARLGGTVDGHSTDGRAMSGLDKLTGTYRTADTRFEVRARDGALWVQAFSEGDLVDEFTVMRDKGGVYFVPEDGTIVRFVTSGSGKATEMEGTLEKSSWRAKRVA